jgi:hypothetical protein
MRNRKKRGEGIKGLREWDLVKTGARHTAQGAPAECGISHLDLIY